MKANEIRSEKDLLAYSDLDMQHVWHNLYSEHYLLTAATPQVLQSHITQNKNNPSRQYNTDLNINFDVISQETTRQIFNPKHSSVNNP